MRTIFKQTAVERSREAIRWERIFDDLMKVYHLETQFREVARRWVEELSDNGEWKAACKVSMLMLQRLPDEWAGWENLAWSLHMLGETKKAYQQLAPLMKGLRLPGPPSGRAAYCLAVFCSCLGKKGEASRWIDLAYAQAVDKKAFLLHLYQEPSLKMFWARFIGYTEPFSRAFRTSQSDLEMQLRSLN